MKMDLTKDDPELEMYSAEYIALGMPERESNKNATSALKHLKRHPSDVEDGKSEPKLQQIVS